MKASLVFLFAFSACASSVGCDKGNDTLQVKIPPGGSGGQSGASGGGGAGGAGGGGQPAPAACGAADCKDQPITAIGCANGTAPQFSCERGKDGACHWSAPRCPATDAGTPPKPEAGTGVACGPVTCPIDQTCCNASCGICTPPGGGCIKILCQPPKPDGGAGGGACQTDSDCRLFDDYCTGCDCRSLAKGEPDPKCSGPGVRCFAQPCARKTAACEAGHCVVR